MRKALADDPELADTPEAIIKSLQKQDMRRANLQWELLATTTRWARRSSTASCVRR